MVIQNLSDQSYNKKMEKNKDKLVAAGGIALIIAVAVFTFARPIFQKSETQNIVKEKAPELEDEYPFVSVSDIEEQTKNKKLLILIDSRSSDEFKQEHVLGAINITNENIGQYLKTVKPESKFILIGNDSNDLSLKLLAEALKKEGQKDFAILSGGQNAWISSGGRTVRLGDPAALSDQAKINIIKSEDLKKIMDSQNFQLYIIDMRSEKAYTAEHLPQSKNIPGNLLEERYKTIPIGKKVVFYAGSELETFQLGVALFDLGISRAQALEGGFSAWKAKGFPTEK